MYKRKQSINTSSTKVKQFKPSTSDPWKKVFSDASEAFKHHQFQEAVTLFTHALTLNPENPTILDCRSACYEKLNQFDLAIRDAVAIVKRAPSESRGYLRAGKILSLEKKYQKALQIYTRALTKVSKQDKRYQQLVDMHRAAQKKASVGTDFMKILPYDVISSIFSLLSFDRRIQCTGVSKTWRNFALNWSGMWRDLDFGNRKISHTLIKQYMSYAKGRHVRRLAMMDADQNRMKKVFQLLIDEDCQYMEVLDLVRCEIPLTMFLRVLRLVGRNVKNIRLDEASLDLASVVESVLPYCPQLTQLSMIGVDTGSFNEIMQKDKIPQLDQLTHLRLSINGGDNIRWLLGHCKSLKLLDLYSTDAFAGTITDLLIHDHFPSIEHLYFTTSNYDRKTQWSSTMPSALGKLNTLLIQNDPTFTGDMLEALIRKYHQSLKHLTLDNCRSLDSTLARMALEPGLPCIETLHIPGHLTLEEWNLHSIISSCPTLQDVDISFISNVTDSIMNDIGDVTKQLKKLNISSCSYVTGVGIQKVINTHRTTLEKLVLNNCQRINPDAIAWAISTLGRKKIECRFS